MSSATPSWATPRRTKWALVALGLCLVALTVGDLWLERQTGLGVGRPFSPDATKPDLWFGYSHEAVIALFELYGPRGRTAYAANLVIDTIYPVVLGAATVLLAARAFRGRARWTWIAPAAFAVLDVIENALLGAALALYPQVPAGLVAVASPITQVKLASFPPTVAVAAVAAAILAARSLGARRRRDPVGVD